MKSRHTPAVALFVVAALGTGAGAGAMAAQAAKLNPNSTYRGKIVETAGKKVLASQRIFFVVDRATGTVNDFTLKDGYPVYCAPKGIGQAQSVTTKLSKKHAFKARLPIYAKHHRRQGSLIVTGKFASRKVVSGKVRTNFTAASRHSCNGSANYKTRLVSKHK